MAVSRVPYLHRILEPHLRNAVLGFRFLSTELSSSVSSTSSSSEGVVQAPPSKNDMKVVGRELAMMRREYEKQIAELRKKYAAEEERKRKEKEMVERITRERIVVEKEKRLVVKKERSQIRAVEVEQEQRSLRATLEETRKEAAARRQWREKRLLRMQAREKQTVRQQSAMWVEEKDLERCIVDALVDPFYLSGSYALPDRDAMLMGDEDDDDDE